MRIRLLAALAALMTLALLAPAAFAQPGGIAIVQLNSQNGSGETGTATLTYVDATHTQVDVTLNGAGSVAQPIHIHEGSCANLNPVPKYPLTTVANGMSSTTVNVGLNDLLGGKYAINVHKSKTEASIYVACGDITALSSGGTNPGMPTTGAGDLFGGAALAALLGAALALLGVGLRRRRAAAR